VLSQSSSLSSLSSLLATTDRIVVTEASAGVVRSMLVSKMNTTLVPNVPAASGVSAQVLPAENSVVLSGLEFPSGLVVDNDRG
jgi:hypothetical protein